MHPRGGRLIVSLARRAKYLLAHLKQRHLGKTPVLLIEYPTNPARQALSREQAHEHGLTWLLTDRPLKTLGVSGK